MPCTASCQGASCADPARCTGACQRAGTGSAVGCGAAEVGLQCGCSDCGSSSSTPRGTAPPPEAELLQLKPWLREALLGAGETGVASRGPDQGRLQGAAISQSESFASLLRWKPWLRGALRGTNGACGPLTSGPQRETAAVEFERPDWLNELLTLKPWMGPAFRTATERWVMPRWSAADLGPRGASVCRSRSELFKAKPWLRHASSPMKQGSAAAAPPSVPPRSVPSDPKAVSRLLSVKPWLAAAYRPARDQAMREGVAARRHPSGLDAQLLALKPWMASAMQDGGRVPEASSPSHDPDVPIPVEDVSCGCTSTFRLGSSECCARSPLVADSPEASFVERTASTCRPFGTENSAVAASSTRPSPFGPSRTGIDFMRFADGSEIPTGTVQQLGHDAEIVGISHLRHLGNPASFKGADVYLSHAWRGSDADRWLNTGPGVYPLERRDLYSSSGSLCGGPSLLAPSDPFSPLSSTKTLNLSVLESALVALPGHVLIPTLGDQGAIAENAPVADNDWKDRVTFSWKYWSQLLDFVDGDYFRLGTVDMRYEGEVTPAGDVVLEADDYRSQDALLEEMVRQAASNPATSWGTGGRLPYLNLGNELDHPGSEEAAKELAWWVLRTAEMAEFCAPGVQRIFPGLHSPNAEPATGLPCGSRFSASPDHVQEYECALDMMFFHIIRAAMRVQEAEGTKDRFSGARLLGSGINDAFTKLTAYIVATGSLAVVPTSPTDLKYADHRDVVHDWCESLRSTTPITAPFDVMDFHWYANRPQVFLYLVAAADVVQAIRGRLSDWWSNGSDLPIWCSETGVSSHRYSTHVEPLLPAGTMTEQDIEVRVSPDDLRTAFGSAYYDPSTGTPGWAFTSEEEQARQVWTRLSFLLATCGSGKVLQSNCTSPGVEKVFWYTNQAVALNRNTLQPQKFYGYGLTHDLDDDEAYDLRDKKSAFCAMSRWNRYLDHAVDVKLLPGLDGRRGFYAVVFRRSTLIPDSQYPYALVMWADPQAYGGPMTFGSEPPELDRGGRWLVFRPPGFFIPPDATSPFPRSVATAPTRFVDLSLTANDLVCDPCLGADDEPGTCASGFYSGRNTLLRFAPDEDLDYGLVVHNGILRPGVPLTIAKDQEVQLILLPEGGLLYEAGERGVRAFDLCTWASRFDVDGWWADGPTC